MKSISLFILTLSTFSVYAQTDLDGVWDTGNENTVVEISQQDGKVAGKIKSSDHEKAKTGLVILKELEKKGNNWNGRVYSAKRGSWYDVEITPNGDVLDLKIRAGFFTKSVVWTRQ